MQSRFAAILLGKPCIGCVCLLEDFDFGDVLCCDVPFIAMCFASTPPESESQLSRIVLYIYSFHSFLRNPSMHPSITQHTSLLTGPS
jgi:hypothetical protein